MSERRVCTWDSPMPKGASGRWAHPAEFQLAVALNDLESAAQAPPKE